MIGDNVVKALNQVRSSGPVRKQLSRMTSGGIKKIGTNLTIVRDGPLSAVTNRKGPLAKATKSTRTTKRRKATPKRRSVKRRKSTTTKTKRRKSTTKRRTKRRKATTSKPKTRRRKATTKRKTTRKRKSRVKSKRR